MYSQYQTINKSNVIGYASHLSISANNFFCMCDDYKSQLCTIKEIKTAILPTDASNLNNFPDYAVSRKSI